jgi:molybdopterin converting factor small subunit
MSSRPAGDGMEITVKLGAPLSSIIGENKVVVSVKDGATAADVLDEMRRRYPDFDDGLRGKGFQSAHTHPLYCLFVNSRRVSWEEAGAIALQDGDQIYLFLPFSGG